MYVHKHTWECQNSMYMKRAKQQAQCFHNIRREPLCLSRSASAMVGLQRRLMTIVCSSERSCHMKFVNGMGTLACEAGFAARPLFEEHLWRQLLWETAEDPPARHRSHHPPMHPAGERAHLHGRTALRCSVGRGRLQAPAQAPPPVHMVTLPHTCTHLAAAEQPHARKRKAVHDDSLQREPGGVGEGNKPDLWTPKGQVINRSSGRIAMHGRVMLNRQKQQGRIAAECRQPRTYLECSLAGLEEEAN